MGPLLAGKEGDSVAAFASMVSTEAQSADFSLKRPLVASEEGTEVAEEAEGDGKGGMGALREACDFCSRRKRKCCGKQPCTNCTKLGVGDKCNYSVKQKSGRKKKQRFDEAGELLPQLERRERPRNSDRQRSRHQQRRKDTTPPPFARSYSGAIAHSAGANGSVSPVTFVRQPSGGTAVAADVGAPFRSGGGLPRAAAPLPSAGMDMGSSDEEEAAVSESYSGGEDYGGGDFSGSSEDGRSGSYRAFGSRAVSTGSGASGASGVVGTTACDFCNRRRRPCDGGQPCRECARHGVQLSCTYAAAAPTGKRGRGGSGGASRAAVQGAMALVSMPTAEGFSSFAAAAPSVTEGPGSRLVLGAAENSHLSTFFSFFGRYMRFTTEAEVRSATIDAALGGGGVGAAAAAAAGATGAESSVAAAMWAAVAVGALLAGVTPPRVQRYARAARRLAEAAENAVVALNGSAASSASAGAAALARARAEALLSLLHDMLGQPVPAENHLAAARHAREMARGCPTTGKVAKLGGGVGARHVDELLEFLEAAKRDRDGVEIPNSGGGGASFPPAPSLDVPILHQGAALGVLAPLNRQAQLALLGLLTGGGHGGGSGGLGGGTGGDDITLRRRAEAWHELLGHADRHMASEIEEPGSPPCPLALATIKADLGWLSLALGRLGAGGDRVEEALQLLRGFPGWVRFPHWGHTAHLLACALAAAGLRESYEDARAAYNVHRMAEQQPALPSFDRRGEIADTCPRCRNACMEVARAFPHAFPAPPPLPARAMPLPEAQPPQQQETVLPRVASTGGFVVPFYPPTPVSPGRAAGSEDDHSHHSGGHGSRGHGGIKEEDTGSSWSTLASPDKALLWSGGKSLAAAGLGLGSDSREHGGHQHMQQQLHHFGGAEDATPAPAPDGFVEETVVEGGEVTLGDAFGMFGPGTRVMVDKTLHSEDYHHLLEMLDDDVPYELDTPAHFDWSQLPVEKQYVTTANGGLGEVAGLVWALPHDPTKDAALADGAAGAAAVAAAATAAGRGAAATTAAAGGTARELTEVGMFGPCTTVMEAHLAAATAAATAEVAAAASSDAAAAAAGDHRVVAPVALDAVLWQPF